MKGFEKLRKTNRSGTTLVELIVTMLVFSMMMVLVVGILSPAAKIFVRMQKLQYAQAILDNTIQELRGITRDATGYVKIYAECAADTDLTVSNGTLDPSNPSSGVNGAATGRALEFVDTEGYVVLLSADGCPDTGIYLGDQLLEHIQESETKEGRLIKRYFVQEAGSTYVYRRGAEAVARAFTPVFADGYYMGNYLEIVFSYLEDETGSLPGDGDFVEYLQAEVKLYSDANRTQLVVQDRVILDLRYQVIRRDLVTATLSN